MKALIKFLPFSLFLLIIISCSENQTKNKEAISGGSSDIPEQKMCELLTMEQMSSITGYKFIEAMSTLHQTDKSTGKYVSQCGYHTDKSGLAVLVRRFGNTAFPTEKDKIIILQKTGDEDMDKMMQEAYESTQTIKDLGDAAYFYDLGGINNLIIIFNKYYQIHISSYGSEFPFDANTLQVSKKVAAEVFKILPQ